MNIPCGRQSISEKDINAVEVVLESDFLTQGPKVLEFEKKLAKYCGAKYAVAVSHGTAALHLAYTVAGFKAGDEVITTPNTFVATANMVMATGASPIFCDIRSDTYNIDEQKIEKLINKKTKAIVPVHFAGQPCDMAVVKKIARKHNLLIIEDACHALGARYKNIKIGSCKHSDMAVFSFHPVKAITTGEGGTILTNNKKYYEKLLLLRNHGIYKDKTGKNVMVEFGYNYRLTDIQAALGISQLKQLDLFIKKRRQIAEYYRHELKDVSAIIMPAEISGNYSAWHLYVIRVKEAKKREKLKQCLRKNNIGVNFHYPAVYSHPYYRENGYSNERLKNTEEYQKSCITIPCHTKLTKNNIKYIAKVIKEGLKI